MSTFTVEIVSSLINAVAVETTIGDNTPNIQILNPPPTNLELSTAIALLPSDFNDNVKSIVGSFLSSGYGVSLFPSGSYLNISVSGLQPSGNYSLVGHSHDSHDILDFSPRVSGLLPVKNIISGSGINVFNTDGTFSVAVTGQFGLTGEQVDDRVSNLLSSGYGINLNYNDNNNILTISTVGLQPSGNYTLVGHSHNINDVNNLQSSLDTKAPIFNPTFSGIVSGITKSMVGLENVDNTSDANKPVSTAAQSALNTKAPIINPVFSGSITISDTSLSGDSVPGNLFAGTINGAGLVIKGGSPISTTKLNINSGGFVSLGEWRATPIGLNYGGTGATTASDARTNLNLGNVDNTSDTNKPISTAVQTALDSKASLIHNHVSNNISDATSFGKNILTAASYAGINDLLWEVPATTGSPPTFTASNGGHYYIPPTLMSLIKFNDPISGINGDFYRVCSFDSNITLNIGNISYTDSGGIDIVRAYSTITSSWETIRFNNHTHVINNVSGLQTALDNKSALVHNHNIADISDLQNTLDNKQPVGNYATLTNGIIPSSQLPSYVDDVLEYSNLLTFPVVGEAGKIYISLDSNKTYRWGGSSYIEISASPGSTDSVAEGSINKYYTDARASAAAPVQSVSGRIGIVTLTKNDVGLSNVDNTSDINKPISTSVQNALDLKSNSGHSHVSSNITDFNSSVSGLLPVKDILSGQYVDVSANSGSYTISVSGLQPSGNYSTVGHSHSYTDIINFASGVDNAVSTALLGGNYIRLNYDNLADTLTISATGLLINNSGDNRILTSTGSSFGIDAESNLTFDGNNTTPTLSISGSFPVIDLKGQGSVIYLSDNQNNIIDCGTSNNYPGGVVSITAGDEIYLTLPWLSPAQTLSITSSGLYYNNIPVSISGHTHISSDITNFNSSVSGLLPVKQLVAGSNVSITNTDGIYTIQSTVSTPSGVLEASRQLVNYNISTDIVGAIGISLEYIYIFNTGSENAGLTLPAAVDNKSVYTLKNNTLGTIYLKTTGSETIDGYDSVGLNRRYSSISVISDGLNWIIV